jgi:hypothetical protein
MDGIVYLGKRTARLIWFGAGNEQTWFGDDATHG